MNPKLKPFNDSISGILLGIQVFFQGCWLLAGQSDYLLSDYAFEFYVFAVIVVAFSGAITFYYVWKYRQNKFVFRVDQKTKLISCAEISTAATAFSLFAIAAYFKSIFDPSNPALLQGDVNKREIIHPYQWLSLEFMLLAYLLLFVSLALFYVSFPNRWRTRSPLNHQTIFRQKRFRV
jgi:hypothetical protein